MKLQELLKKQRELMTRMANATEEEMVKLQKEYDANKREIDLLNQEETAAKNAAPAKKRSANEIMREDLKNLRDAKTREAIINTFSTIVEDSGTQPQNVHAVINTLNEGLNLPVGCSLVGGVTGNDIWPVGVNDVDMEEVGENVELSDTELDFDNITCSPKRAGLTIDVSNKALDEEGFDVYGYIMNKIQLAKRKYLAQKIYSQAAFTGVKGPFSGLTPAGTITIGTEAYKAILTAVAAFTNVGFTGEPCLIMDAVTEAELKATPKAEGQGGFIIEGGKCAGYNYVVSHYINTTLSDGKIVSTDDRYLGIGYFNYLAVQQHGKERLTTDGTSKAVAIANKFNVTYNTEFSITDLSVKLNKKGGTTTQAFALYKLA